MNGFFAAEASDWPEVVEVLQSLGLPWPEGAIRTDLRWLDDQVRRGLLRRMPNSKALGERYSRTEWSVRKLVSDESWWKDDYHDKEGGRENSAKTPRRFREDSANRDTDEGQESAESREDSAKKSRKRREKVATRADVLEHRSPDTEHKDPSPLPPAGAGGVQTRSLVDAARRFLEANPQHREGGQQRTTRTAKAAKSWLDRAGLLPVGTSRDALADALVRASFVVVPEAEPEARARSPGPFERLENEQRRALVDEAIDANVPDDRLSEWLDQRAAQLLAPREPA